jgi:hypothetical protein
MTKQPSWIVTANLGDASPLEHGGAFVLIDASGTYEPELWRYYPKDCQLIRFSLDRCLPIDGGAIGDNYFHPHLATWFGSVEDLNPVANCSGNHMLREQLCGANVIERACAYLAICDYWGSANFDQYPDSLTPSQAGKLMRRLLSCMKSGKVFSPSLA